MGFIVAFHAHLMVDYGGDTLMMSRQEVYWLYICWMSYGGLSSIWKICNSLNSILDWNFNVCFLIRGNL